ncbi:MAG TPA: PQQ-binding-like beta-propeller repeat protein [Candidatus Tumulicola sp.]
MQGRVLACSALSFAFACTPALANSPAAMFRAGADHLGVYDSAAPKLATVKWRFFVHTKFISSPTIYDGVVYVGGVNRKLYAIRADDGKLLWSFTTKGAVTSSPAVWNSKVVVGSIDGSLYALDSRTGKLVWQFKTDGETRYGVGGIHGLMPSNEVMPEPFDMFISSPAIAGSTVYFGSGDRNVYAVDAQTGALRWKFATGNVVHAAPAVSNGVVYVGSFDRYLYALDAANGALKWKFETGDDPLQHNMVGNVSSATIADGLVFFGSRDGYFYALDADTGSLRWRHDDHGSWIISSPAFYDGNIYYVTSDEHVFLALDALTGKERFHVADATFSYSSPSIASGHVYYGAFDGRLYDVDIAAKTVVGVFDTDGSKKNRPAHVKADGTIDLRSFDSDGTYEGLIAAVDRIASMGSIVGAPAIANGVVYFSSTDGTVYAVN